MGQRGIERFFDTHTCNAVCAHLGLANHSGRELKRTGTLPRPTLVRESSRRFSVGALALAEVAPARHERLLQSVDPQNFAKKTVLKAPVAPRATASDATQLYVANSDKSVSVWNLETLEPTDQFKTHERPIHHLVLADNFLFTGPCPTNPQLRQTRALALGARTASAWGP